jgi:hypothetical protein
MKSEYANLREFLGAYFHQDWTLDSDSSMDVARFYLSEWPREEAILAMKEIELLLSSRSEEDVDRLVESMGCYFVPSAEGYKSFADWLRSIEMLMRQTLAAND